MIILLGAGLFLAGYLLGSVPFGLVLTRLAGYGDIRRIGSGNIGATNVLRTGNKPLAALTLILDSGKGAIAVLLAFALLPTLAGSDPAAQAAAGDLPLLAGAGAMLGHTFPVWLGFRGGKGVATALGVLLAAAWPVGLAACLLWLLTALAFRISSLSALVALAGAVPLSFLLDAGDPAGWPVQGWLALVIAVLVFIRHDANIRRLLRGTEPRINLAGKLNSSGPK